MILSFEQPRLFVFLIQTVFRSISRKDLVDYVSLFYKPARMVLAGAGGVSHDELVRLGEQHFGNVPPANMDHPLARQTALLPCRYTGTFSINSVTTRVISCCH